VMPKREPRSSLAVADASHGRERTSSGVSTTPGGVAPQPPAGR
jgi:hypothetical protein